MQKNVNYHFYWFLQCHCRVSAPIQILWFWAVDVELLLSRDVLSFWNRNHPFFNAYITLVILIISSSNKHKELALECHIFQALIFNKIYCLWSSSVHAVEISIKLLILPWTSTSRICSPFVWLWPQGQHTKYSDLRREIFCSEHVICQNMVNT